MSYLATVDGPAIREELRKTLLAGVRLATALRTMAQDGDDAAEVRLCESLAASVDAFEVLAPAGTYGETVDPGHECPVCDEDRVVLLVADDDDTIACQTCGAVFALIGTKDEAPAQAEPEPEPEEPRRYCGRCHTCGQPLRKVLDGEEWCDTCQTYRRYVSHGWSVRAVTIAADTSVFCPPRK